LNTFSYATSNPLMGSDPLGLVEWTGTFSGGAVGRATAAGFYAFELTSQCVNGTRARVQGIATAVGFGYGVSLSFTTQPVTFKDYETNLNPMVFEGNFLYAQAGFAICSRNAGCAGFGYTAIQQLGNAYAEPGWSSQKGLDMGANVVAGRSIVTSHKVEPCCAP
jgi:hypothetical protein